MTTAQLATALVAALSLFVSIVVLVRDRRRRQIDTLYKCYDRLHEAHGDRPFATVSDLVEMDDNSKDPRWEEYKQKSRDAQRRVERELEFACFLVHRGEIDLEMFFYLFRGWLASREMFWRVDSHHEKAKNYPYTVLVIDTCMRKRLLPIKHNRELLKLRAKVERFLAT